MTIVTPSKVLREKLGDDGVDALVELVNKANEKQKEDVFVILEEKFERRLAETASGLEVKIAQSKSEIIKWMFIFWVGQIAVLTGLMLAFSR